MYVDYDGGADAVETVPGFRKLYGFGQKINAIYLHNLGNRGKFLLVHSGTKLYRFNVDMRDNLKNLQSIAELEDTRSHAFNVGDDLYVMDGKSMIKIDSSGTALRVADDGGAPPHVPTTYKNEKKTEEYNLLNRKFVQKFDIPTTNKYAYYTKNLTFDIIDSEKRLCAVTGGPKEYNGDLFIPATAMIDGEEYKVTEIAPSAFLGFESITSVYGGSNLERVGKYAFKDCLCLEYAVFGNSLKFIEYSAFCNSSAFREIYLGLGFESFAPGAVINCNLSFIHYAGDEQDFHKIEGISQLGDAQIYYFSSPNDVNYAFPISGDVLTVDEVYIGDEKQYFFYDAEWQEVNVYHTDRASLIGKEVTVIGTLNFGKFADDAILGCTVSCAHDGRIFLSGNPNLPGYVFYSTVEKTSELFFSSKNYFIDGVSDYPVTALLSVNGTLTVFKSQDDGSGSIFCHTSESADGKRNYPVAYVHGGISGSSSPYVIADSAVFLSDNGLSALENVAGSSFKELACISGEVNRKLLHEDLTKATITEWCGYLVICAGEHFYLADRKNRQKASDYFAYDWYFMNRIGTYKDGRRVFRYSSLSIDEYSAHPTATDEKVSGVVMSVVMNGKSVFYVTDENGKHYQVYPTDEFYGGSFSPACFAIGIEKLLFFGTESGDLCVFNNDKRGVVPEHISSDADFDSEAYSELMGDKIHPYFYTFADRPIICSLKTANDDCDIPHLTKSTVRSSLVLKCKNYADGGFSAEAVTDRAKPCYLGKYSTGRLTFANVGFDCFNFSTSPYSIISIPENEHGWVEKQLCFGTNAFRSPFGICSATYRYRIKGKIKNY